MFRKEKNDRLVVELVVAFNLTAINRWLNKGKLKDIEKLEKEWDPDDFVKSYYIDVLPNGQLNDAYFHRQKSIISNYLDGSDYLENDIEGIKVYLGDTKIERISWQHRMGLICLVVNNELLLAAPTAEIADLQEFVGGINLLKKGFDKYFAEEQKVKVPISVDDNGQPNEFFTAVWKHTNSPRHVRYKNALASVSAAIDNSGVEY